MNDNLKQLIELQKIDLRLLSIEELRGDLPVMVQKLTENLEKSKSDKKNAEGRIEEISSEVKKKTNEIEDSITKLEKLKEQLYLVKSNKEYDALNFEIDHLKELINNAENIILDLEQEKESVDEENKNFQIEIDDASKTLDKKSDELKLTMSKTQEEESELNKARVQLVNKIEVKFISTYDRLRKAKDGLGVMSILSNACGACYTQLPRQTVIEVKDSVDVISCPNCSTYLFFDEELN